MEHVESLNKICSCWLAASRVAASSVAASAASSSLISSSASTWVIQYLVTFLDKFYFNSLKEEQGKRNRDKGASAVIKMPLMQVMNPVYDTVWLKQVSLVGYNYLLVVRTKDLILNWLIFVGHNLYSFCAWYSSEKVSIQIYK